MKKRSSFTKLTSVAGLAVAALVLSACENADPVVPPDPLETTEQSAPKVDEPTPDSDQPANGDEPADSDEPANGDEPADSGTDQPTPIKVNPDIENYKPHPIEDVQVADNGKQLLVDFAMSIEPCHGARGDVVETSETITVSLEVGTNKDTSLVCAAVVDTYRLTLDTDEVVGDREIIFNAPDNDNPPIEEPADGSEYLNLSKKEAIAKAEGEGTVWRITKEDGEVFSVTQDFVPDRINFEIEQGVVVKVEFG